MRDLAGNGFVNLKSLRKPNQPPGPLEKPSAVGPSDPSARVLPLHSKRRATDEDRLDDEPFGVFIGFFYAALGGVLFWGAIAVAVKYL